MATIADSSVLVSAFNIEDSQHKKGLQDLSDSSKPILVSEYVAIETTGVLSLRSSRHIAMEFIKVLLERRDLQLIRTSQDFFYLVSAYFVQAKLQLSFVDCSLVLLSRDFDILTFDRTLEKAIKARR